MPGKRSGGGRTIFALLLHTVVSKGEGESRGWIRHDGFSVVRRHIGVRRYPMQPLKYELALSREKWRRIVIVNSVEEKKKKQLMCELRLPCCWVAYIPTAVPFLCLVIEFDNASAQAAPGARLYGWLVCEEGFFVFFHTIFCVIQLT